MIACLEIDNEGKTIFVGGSTKEDGLGEPIINAYSFDKKLKAISASLISEGGTKCISRLVRIKNTNKLFAGVNHTVVVFEYAADKFNIVGKIRQLNSNSRLS